MITRALWQDFGEESDGWAQHYLCAGVLLIGYGTARFISRAARFA
jgi:hypothetical protein